MERNIKAISEFLFIEDELSDADILIVPGTFHIEIVQKALEVYDQGLTPYILTTGGILNEEGIYEADFQKQYLQGHGVPEEKIFTETRSTNTKENAVIAREVLDQLAIPNSKIILISKAYHSRRILMTFLASFPESEILIAPVVDSRNMTKDNWFEDEEKRAKVIEELEKIGEYYLKGDLSL